MSRIKGVWPLLAALTVSQGAIAQGFPSIGGFLGAGAGGGNAAVANLVAGTVTGLMGQILQSLTAREQQQRQQALQEAARGPSGSTASWSTPQPAPNSAQRATPSGNSAPAPKRASYVNKGQVADASGRKCSRVLETITMPDGQTGTSEQLVCPS
jgi:hypothetical protein